ncbi:sensor histidine kinase [Acidocella sp.]|uniref:sensor histidine kinase n=1 Tax=Acidocella sp. TaxID=50710 RepID=UPI003D056623
MTMPEEKTPVQDERLEQFAARVAHDFNNLLTGVLGNLELSQLRAARSGALPDAYLDGARSAGARAALFARRLMWFSGHAAPAKEALDVAVLLRELAAVEGGISPGLPETLPACVDPDALGQAVRELLENARDALEGGGQIVLAAAERNGWVAITVRDDGPGMTPETLARAREPLFTTRANGAGRGLGLPIAERVARRAGGWLELESQAGQGCVARLVLPKA